MLSSCPVPALTLTLLLAAPDWPAPEVSVARLPLPPLASRIRIAIDAGHGAPGNRGNEGCLCQSEADETLVESRELARRLLWLGFEVLETRTTVVGDRYAGRIAAIERFRPHLVVSLHTDARADARPSRESPDGGVCWQNSDDPGFSVLWSDEGPDAIVERRREWGRAVSRALRAAGFLAYDGNDYGSLYRFDDEPGCFIDDRPARQRVYFLRATTRAPVVIVETHHALDPVEVARWHDAATHDAFATAIASAAIEVVEQR